MYSTSQKVAIDAGLMFASQVDKYIVNCKVDRPSMFVLECWQVLFLRLFFLSLHFSFFFLCSWSPFFIFEIWNIFWGLKQFSGDSKSFLGPMVLWSDTFPTPVNIGDYTWKTDSPLSPPTQKWYFVICWMCIQYPCIIFHLEDINECGWWITLLPVNKKEVIVLIKMDFKYKKQNVWKIIHVYIRVY